MPKRRTHEEFVALVREQFRDAFTFLTQYEKQGVKVYVQHECGHKYWAWPDALIRGHGCKKCADQKKKITHLKYTDETFKEEVRQRVGDEYEFQEAFLGMDTPISLLHKVCGYTYPCRPKHFFYVDSRCPKCSGRDKTHDDYVKQVKEQVGQEYEVTGTYQGALQPIEIRHVICGHEFSVRAANFTSTQSRCPKCGGSMPLTQEEYEERIEEMGRGEYEVLGEYQNNYKKVLLKHKVCEEEFLSIPYAFYDGRRCPYCNQSHGERLVEEWLKDQGMTYKIQHSFPNCVFLYPLSFDFVVWSEGEVKACVEYDGKQHFEPIAYFGGEEGFEQTQIRDSIKNEYCVKKRIPLIRIPYTEEKRVKEILNEQFKNLS